MSTEWCWGFPNLHLTFNPITESIDISRCCISLDIIKSYSLEEWKNLDDLESELNKVVNIWPENLTITSRCPVSNCFYDKKITLKRVDVAFDYECNVKCKWCFTKEERDLVRKSGQVQKVKKLYFDTLYKIAKFNNPVDIRLTDRGEPFFWKKDIKEFLRFLSATDVCRFYATTNGILLDDELISIIKDMKQDVGISVSLNALSRDVYKDTMGVDAFQIVMDNIQKLKEAQIPYIVNYVYSTKKDIEDLIKQIPIWESEKIRFSVLPVSGDFELGTTPEIISLENELKALLSIKTPYNCTC